MATNNWINKTPNELRQEALKALEEAKKLEQIKKSKL
jgi:hypothetical protein